KKKYHGLMGRGDQIQAQFGRIFRFLHRREREFNIDPEHRNYYLAWRKAEFRKLSLIMAEHLQGKHDDCPVKGLYGEDHPWFDIDFNCKTQAERLTEASQPLLLLAGNAQDDEEELKELEELEDAVVEDVELDEEDPE